MIIVYLTCRNEKEAGTIGDALLEARLVACVRFTRIESSYWWEGKIEDSKEIMMTMESREDKFEKINDVVGKLHSYDEYALTAVAVAKTTTGVLKWLDDSLAQKDK